MQCGVQSHPLSKSKDKQNSRQQYSSGLPCHSPAAKITNVTLKVQKAAFFSPGSQCCTYYCMHYNALMWLCVTCVFYELRSLCNATNAAVLDLNMSSLFVFCFTFGLKKCIFLCSLTSLWVQDHANVSLCLFSALRFVPSLTVLLFAMTAEGDICHFVCWFWAGLPCGEGDMEILWMDNYLRVLFKVLSSSKLCVSIRNLPFLPYLHLSV